MPTALLRAISEIDLPLLVDDPDELLQVRHLLDGGWVQGVNGLTRRLPCGQIVVTRPALIRDVTPMGRPFLLRPDPRVDPLAELL